MTKWYESKERILVIGDTQSPFQHEDTIPFLKALKKKYKPTRVVHIGDVIDGYHLGAWARDPEALSQTDEIKGILKFGKEIAKVFPNVDVLKGNHCLRVERAMHRAQIHTFFLRPMHEYMGVPDTWVFHDKLEIDGITFSHGDDTGPGAGGASAAISRALNYGGPCVFGHHHTFSEVRYVATPKQLMWGMFVGSLIDHKKIAFAYAKKQLRKPILSSGIIINGQPTVVPMVCDDNGRWIGRLL